MAGQNMGANNRELVRETTNTGLCLNLAITAVAVLFVQIFAGPIIRLFDPVSPEVTRDGILYLRICCGLNSLIYGAMYTFDSFAIGVGSANVAMVNAISPILPAVAGGLYFKSRIWERGNLIRRKGTEEEENT